MFDILTQLYELRSMSPHETRVAERSPEEIEQEAAREREFVAGVCEGFAQLDRGEGVPLEEVERLLPSWIKAATA